MSYRQASIDEDIEREGKWLKFMLECSQNPSSILVSSLKVCTDTQLLHQHPDEFLGYKYELVDQVSNCIKPDCERNLAEAFIDFIQYISRNCGQFILAKHVTVISSLTSRQDLSFSNHRTLCDILFFCFCSIGVDTKRIISLIMHTIEKHTNLQIRMYYLGFLNDILWYNQVVNRKLIADPIINRAHRELCYDRTYGKREEPLLLQSITAKHWTATESLPMYQLLCRAITRNDMLRYDEVLINFPIGFLQYGLLQVVIFKLIRNSDNIPSEAVRPALQAFMELAQSSIQDSKYNILILNLLQRYFQDYTHRKVKHFDIFAKYLIKKLFESPEYIQYFEETLSTKDTMRINVDDEDIGANRLNTLTINLVQKMYSFPN